MINFFAPNMHLDLIRSRRRHTGSEFIQAFTFLVVEVRLYLYMQTALEFYERLLEIWVPDINLHSSKVVAGGRCG